MEIPSEPLLTNRSKTYILALFSWIMVYFLTYMVDPTDVWWEKYFKRPTLTLLVEWALTFLFCVWIAKGSFFIHKKLNKPFPWFEKPLKRLLIETFFNIVFVFVLLVVQFGVFVAMNEIDVNKPYTQEDHIALFQWIMISCVIALMISGFHTGDFLIANWKNTALEAATQRIQAAELKQVVTEAELQALKLQLDPHFVFNSLSVLSELILESQQLGYEYAESLAKVYRYLLVNSKKDLITLQDEIKFLKAYIFLLGHRAGKGIVFNINIDGAYNNLHLPPMTVQLLIENAIKHNKTLKESPLKVTIETSAGPQLIVSNTLAPLEKKMPSSGIGLENIRMRYRLLSDKEPVVYQNETEFSVRIPLLHS